MPKYRDENTIYIKAINTHNKEEFESLIANMIKTGWEKYSTGIQTTPNSNPTQHPHICWWAIMIKREIKFNLLDME